MLDTTQWDDLVDSEGFARFEDTMARAAETGTLVVVGPTGDLARVGYEALTRFQRFAPRRNAASRSQAFSRVLAAHASLHRSDKPLVIADRDHAVDTWQWALRLDPEASFEIQVAALYHDVERLVSEADARIEHLAPDYQAFKDAHAKGSASMARSVLAEIGLPDPVVDRICSLLRGHERRPTSREATVLSDADCLSFFSHNASGYLAYFGVDQTRRKIRFTLGRLSAAARPALDRIRMPRDVRALLSAELVADLATARSSETA